MIAPVPQRHYPNLTAGEAAVHWHVARHSEDDNPYVTSDLYAALAYASEELDLMAEHEHTGIGALGDDGQFEEAYRAFQRCEAYNALHLNALNIVSQHERAPADRAPLYQDDPGEVRLRESALHVVDGINAGSPMVIWDCGERHCGGCGDLIHENNNTVLYDSSGDPLCWAAEEGTGPHRDMFAACPCCKRDGHFSEAEWGICSDCADAGDHQQEHATEDEPYPYCAATDSSELVAHDQESDDTCSDCLMSLSDPVQHCDHCGMCTDALGECPDCGEG